MHNRCLEASGDKARYVSQVRTDYLWHKKVLEPDLLLEVERINKAFETKEDY